MSMTLFDGAKAVFSMAADAATAGAACAALCWFIFSRSFKRRVEFDVDLKIFDVAPEHDYVAELILAIDNKGQREHRLYNLWAEVRQTKTLAKSSETVSYLELKNLVPEKLEYFFIQAGVRQTFPVTFTIPRQEKLVRVMAVFTYEPKRVELASLGHLAIEKLDEIGFTTHSVSRLFEVKPRANT